MSHSPSTSKSQSSSTLDMKSPYNENQLKKAAQSLSNDIDMGCLRFLRQRNVIHCDTGPGWQFPNMWEGTEGFMEHITRKFPTPERISNKAIMIEDEEEDDVLVVNSSGSDTPEKNKKSGDKPLKGSKNKTVSNEDSTSDVTNKKKKRKRKGKKEANEEPVAKKLNLKDSIEILSDDSELVTETDITPSSAPTNVVKFDSDDDSDDDGTSSKTLANIANNNKTSSNSSKEENKIDLKKGNAVGDSSERKVETLLDNRLKNDNSTSTNPRDPDVNSNDIIMALSGVQKEGKCESKEKEADKSEYSSNSAVSNLNRNDIIRAFHDAGKEEEDFEDETDNSRSSNNSSVPNLNSNNPFMVLHGVIKEEGEIEDDNEKIDNNGTVAIVGSLENTSSNIKVPGFSKLEKQSNRIKADLNSLNKQFVKSNDSVSSISSICKKMLELCTRIEKFGQGLDQRKDFIHSKEHQRSCAKGTEKTLQMLEIDLDTVWSQYEKIRVVRGDVISQYNSACNSSDLKVRSPYIKKWQVTTQS